MDEAALVLAAREGDRDAFAAIYDRYADRLHSFLVTILHDHDDAADVLHDTFLDAGMRLHQLRDPAKLRPWLFATARHNAFRRLRARSKLEPIRDMEMIASNEAVQDAEGVELRQLVVAASEGLSPRDRALLDLHLVHGLEGKELGEVMGLTVGHAHVLLNRLRAQFERALGALLIARQGSQRCTELAALLEGWDGRFTPLLRKRVARHADRCEVCSETRRGLATPAEVLGALPLIPAPGGMRERVLSDVDLVAHRSPLWLRRRGGFPPHETDPARRTGRALLGMIAAAVLVIGGMIWAGEEAPGTGEIMPGPTTGPAVVGSPTPSATPAGHQPATAEETKDATAPDTGGNDGGFRSGADAGGTQVKDIQSGVEDNAARVEESPTPLPTLTPRPTPSPQPTPTRRPLTGRS